MFVDCTGYVPGCDLDYIRTEIPFVDYVRDPHDADVDVLLSTLATGAGGTEYTAVFLGQRANAGVQDTLRWFSSPTASQDDQRAGLVRLLKFGLLRYVAGTPIADRIDITFRDSAESGHRPPPHDPWNFWVFGTSFGGNYSAQSSSSNYSLYTSLSANRVTDRWKVNIALNGNYNENNFHYTQTVTDSLGDSVGTEALVANKSVRSFGASALVVRSLSGHWSVGAHVLAAKANFSNEAFAVAAAPAVEFDVFPYSESTHRQFTMVYQLGPSHFDYLEETVFFKRHETLVNQSLVASFATTQRWGSVSLSAEFATYIPQTSQNHVSLFASGDVRLVRGLSVNLYVSGSAINDQRSLANTAVDIDDVLLARRQLKTSFQYSAFFGLSYTFGSIFNNVVNPRFNGSLGGFNVSN